MKIEVCSVFVRLKSDEISQSGNELMQLKAIGDIEAKWKTGSFRSAK
jgi:hypothetical protein